MNEDKIKHKIKFDVKIEICSNGALVIIKNVKTKEKEARVFEGKGYEKRYAKWIDKFTSPTVID
ncbi:hypothetical protein LCGC14_0374130 [marine sediment metagenome]|uniref:Uncharacterized protein n=1 Tax=marine sediment metagenome TaxID=412755 RepID=A0A0F9WCU4_9ZZZZ